MPESAVHGEYVQRFEAITSGRLKQVAGPLRGEGTNLLLLESRGRDASRRVAWNQPIRGGLLQGFVQSYMYVLDRATTEPCDELLAVEAANVCGSKALELHFAQGGDYVAAGTLLISRVGCGSHRVLGRIEEPARQVLSYRQRAHLEDKPTITVCLSQCCACLALRPPHRPGAFGGSTDAANRRSSRSIRSLARIIRWLDRPPKGENT